MTAFLFVLNCFLLTLLPNQAKVVFHLGIFNLGRRSSASEQAMTAFAALNQTLIAEQQKTEDQQQVIDTLKIDLYHLKSQVFQLKAEQKTWFKEKAKMKQQLQEQQLDMHRNLEKEKALWKAMTEKQIEEENRVLIQTLQREFQLQKENLENQLHHEYQEEIAELKNELALLIQNETVSQEEITNLKLQLTKATEEIKVSNLNFKQKESNYIHVRIISSVQNS
jgi:hypothetical protein